MIKIFVELSLPFGCTADVLRLEKKKINYLFGNIINT